MESWLLQYGPLGILIICMFLWFQNRTMDNRRLIQEVVREMREHREECNDRYEETARDQAKFGTTLTQVVDTLRRVDERTQTTHDQVTALRVLVNNK